MYATIISGKLQRVGRYLTHETAVKVANAMVSSHLDYCNSLLYHTKKTNINRLQRIQNILQNITYKAINCSQPPYLSSLIKCSDLIQGNHLSVSSTITNKCMHSFAVAATREWNKLPQAVRTQDSINGFRQKLKLFRLAYLPP